MTLNSFDFFLGVRYRQKDLDRTRHMLRDNNLHAMGGRQVSPLLSEAVLAAAIFKEFTLLGRLCTLFSALRRSPK